MAEDFVSGPRTKPKTWDTKTKTRTRTQLFVFEAPRKRGHVLENTSLHPYDKRMFRLNVFATFYA